MAYRPYSEMSEEDMWDVHSGMSVAEIEEELERRRGEEERDEELRKELYDDDDYEEENGVFITPQQFASELSLINANELLLSAQTAKETKEALKMGADPNAIDDEYRSALMNARTLGQMQILIKAGADINYKDCAGEDALDHLRFRTEKRVPTSEEKNMINYLKSIKELNKIRAKQNKDNSHSTRLTVHGKNENNQVANTQRRSLRPERR